MHFTSNNYFIFALVFVYLSTHVSLFKFVDIVFAHEHESLPCVTQVTDNIEEDAGVGATATDISCADGDPVLNH